MNKPKLRFKEFSDEWSPYHVEELVNSKVIAKPMDGNHGGLHPKSEDYVQEGIPFVMANDIRNGDIDLNHCHKISKKQADNLQKGFSIIGDVLLTHKGTVGETAVVRNITTDYIMLTPQVTYYRVLNKKKINNIFLEKYFQSQVFQRKLTILSSGGTRAYIGITEQRKLLVSLPSLAEQEKIATLLSSVDQKISLLTQKHELLISYKKGVMQKIFNQEIGFKDSSKSNYPKWEQDTLGAICKITTGKLDANAMVENGEYRFYTCAKEYFQIDNYAFDTDALLISGNGANVGYIHHYKGKFNAYQRTYVLDKFSQDIFYIKYFLDQFLPKRIASEKNEGNTPYIVMGTLSEMLIKLPTIEEQRKISSFLLTLDEKICNVQNQLGLIKQYKQGLLQHMFI